MINKKGFTLMELLGVIIILSILLLIALPSVINSVKNSQSDIDEVTEKLIIDAVNLLIDDSNGYYDSSDNSKFCIPLTELIEEDYLKSPIKYKNLDDISNTYSIKVTYNKDYSYELIDSNECPDPVYVAKVEPTTGIKPRLDTNGNFIPGSEFNIKVSDEIGYLTFFVLSNDGDYVNLIAQKNLAPDGTLSAENQTGDEWYSKYNNRYGPQTAYSYLRTATYNWTNIPPIKNFNYLDEGNSSYGYIGITTKYDSISDTYVTTITPFSSDYGNQVKYSNMKARLPYYNEIIYNTSCTPNTIGSCYTKSLWAADYLYTNSSVTGGTNAANYSYGYWLLSSHPGYSGNARRINYSGYISALNTNDTNYGIRPVITVLKSELIRTIQ